MKRSWTAEELKYLKENIGKQKIKTIAEKLGRTENAVLIKAKRLNIANTKQMQGEISLGELALLIHIDRKTLHNWIHKGLFPAHKKVTRSKRSFYFVKPNEFWRWAFRHKEKVNFSKIEPYSILPEPKWVQEERRRDSFAEEKRYRYWTVGEMKSLLEYSQNGLNCSSIAKKLNRSPDSIRMQLSRAKSLSR